jgi:hypothetical protein
MFHVEHYPFFFGASVIISAHQVNYWPYPGFFKKIVMSDLFILLGKLQFNKQSWQNRNRIVNQNSLGWLTVPVFSKQQEKQKISEVRINNDIDWRRKHFRTIELNYHACPYYDQLKDFFREVWLERQWNSLYELNCFIIEYVIKILFIETPIHYDCDYSFKNSKTDYILSIIESTGASAYLSSPNAIHYLELEKFRLHHILHFYLIYQSPVYFQRSECYYPDLSIIDMICCCGIDKTSDYLRTDLKYYQTIDFLRPVKI